MLLALTIAVAVVAILGHAAIWVGLVNRWHSTGYPRKVIKSVTLLFYAGLIAPPLAAAWYALSELWPPPETVHWKLNGATAYIAFCAAYGAVHIPTWALSRLGSLRRPEAVQLRRNHVVDVAEELGSSPARGWRTEIFSRIPANQLWQLHVSEFSLAIPGLNPLLEGLSICHWSDLHLSGRIDRGYFREVVRLTNELRVDLIALTGDICDRAAYIDWLPEILGPATAVLGKYFVLGNHDLRTKDVRRLRASMCEAGFADVGGRWESIDNRKILIAGDERPWFKADPLERPLPVEADDPSLKILLSHTPDRLDWARLQGFDLMLAGHTHGGQIRFPIVGPVLCPSWHGTRYSGGFYHQPPTLMHVSRGTASLMPLRLNCPPEITKLVLYRADG
jgi:predicted MPP superfamily phosphohydrolase